MKIRRAAALSALALAASAGAARAQGLLPSVVRQPHFYVFFQQQPCSYPPTCPVRDMCDPGHYLTNMVRAIDWAHVHDPVASANVAVQWILNDLGAGRMEAGHICIFPFNFGHSPCGSSTYGCASEDLTTRDAMIVLADRLENRGFAISDNPQFTPWPNGNSGSNRTYLHPFLTNAQLPTGSWQPPLRQFMIEFCDRYRARQGELNLPGQPVVLPDPDKFFLDTEVDLVDMPDSNHLWLLDWIRQQPTIWSNSTSDPQWMVPGYHPDLPSGQTPTLEHIYAAEHAHYGMLADIASAINTGLPADNSFNRPVMLWYGALCARAIDFALWNCCYSVVHGADHGWPDTATHKIECGNYDHERMDGAPGNLVPWHIDWVDAGHQNIDHPEWRGHPNNLRPRSRLYGWQNSYDYVTSAGQRWTSLEVWGSGEVDSPPIYMIPNDGWLYPGPGCGLFRHRQANLYLPPATPAAGECRQAPQTPVPYRDETQLRSSLRVAGTTLALVGNLAGRLAPWLPTMRSDVPSDAALEGFCQLNQFAMSEPGLRRLLGVCRAYNIGEGTFWAGLRSDLHPTLAAHVWARTADAVRRVWAPRILAAYDGAGTLTGGFATDHDVSRCEFLLPDSIGQQRTIEVTADAGSGITELLVKFTGLADYPSDTPDQTTSGWKYEVTVDDATTFAGMRGYVFVWDYAIDTRTGQQRGWAMAPTLVDVPSGDAPGLCGYDEHGNPIYTPFTETDTFQFGYQFHTPDLSSRRTFIINPDSLLTPAPRYVVGGSMLLKLVHAAPVPQNPSPTVKAIYDLIQVAPFSDECATPGPTQAPPPLHVAQGDKTYDGSVAAEDLTTFLTYWAAGKPAADMNMDGIVDEADLALYMTYYANGD
jgi:hypothetical protein